MKTLKQISLLLLVCLCAIPRLHAQMGWARAFNISTAIPGAAWNDVCKVIKADQNRHIVAGSLTNGSCVVARFSQDGIAGWVREIQGNPGSTINLYDIAESKDPSNPGYVICGVYAMGGTDYNYLARLDDLGNVLWDHYWQADARLRALVLTASNEIVATGSAMSGGVVSTTAYRFDNAGNALNAKIISTDPEMFPVDILEDPLHNGTGGFFILANYKAVGAANRQAYCIFINNNLSFVLSHVLNYIPVPPPNQKYTYTEPVCFEQDASSRDLIILANTKGSARDLRPSVIRFNPVSLASSSSVVLDMAGVPATESLKGTALYLNNNNIANGIMVTATHQFPGSGIKSYTWQVDNMLKTQNLFEQWLSVSNVKNTSLCLAKDNQHYVLAGHDGGNYLTLNVVNLNGDKVDVAGTSKCITPQTWTDEHPGISPNAYNYTSNNLPVNPVSVSTSGVHSWWHEGACWCAEVPVEPYFRYAYPQIVYDSWELDINRATRAGNGNIYIANTLDLGVSDRAYMLELNAAGQEVDVYATMGAGERDGRQFMGARNGDLLAAYRAAPAGGSPQTIIARFSAGGSPTWWGSYFPGTQTPGRLYMAEALNGTNDIIVAGDIEGPDETSNTHDLVIARLTSSGVTIYYREIPVTFNGAQRDNFRVHALEPTRDGGFAICGSTGSQGADFIAGFVMKFSATGALVWQYDFRRQTPGNCYNLNGSQDCRSASQFFDLRQNGANGYYVSGYTSDHGIMGQGASFWNGLLVHLDNSGNELAVQEYNDNSGRQATFKGITVSASNIAVVGELVVGGNRTDLFASIDKTTLMLANAQTYGHGTNSSLHDIFQGSASGAGYTLVGSTTDWNGILTPLVMSVDANGSDGCEAAVDMGNATPVNDPVSLDLNPPANFTSNLLNDELSPTCIEVFDICQELAPAAIRPVRTGLEDFGSRSNTREAAEIAAYPNPASTVLNLGVPKDVSILSISIVDLNGKEVYRSSVNINNTIGINISELPQGMYAVRMETSTGKRFTRFVKL